MSARLILHPRGDGLEPDNATAVVEALRDCGFIGDRFAPAGGDADSRHFLIGDHFLQLVTFMGCAPAIELSPPADGSLDFCHVGISPVSPRFHFLFDEVLATPRCPHCRKAIAGWQDRIAGWQQGELAAFDCHECTSAIEPLAINWRRAGGFTRLSVTVYGIYPREAIPTEPLLAALGRATGGDWDYFYAR